MKIYRCLKLNQKFGINLWSTDAQTLDFIVDEVKKLVSSCQVHTYRDEPKINLDKLQDRDQEILWRIMELIGKQGWEPFAVYPSTDGSYYHFRQEVIVVKYQDIANKFLEPRCEKSMLSRLC